MLERFKRWLGGAEPELILADAEKNPPPKLPSDARFPTRLGFFLLIVGFGGFIAWAATMPIDEGVPAPGSVVQESKRKTIQHLSGGIVAEVLVTEGEWVKSGQVLLRLRDAQAKAARDSAQHSFFSLAAMRARLDAEQRNSPAISFPAVLAKSDSPLAIQHMTAQRELFSARHRALHADLAVLQETGRSASETAKGLEEQLTFMKKELAGIRDLAVDGYLPRNQQLAAERQLLELTVNGQRARSQAAEMELRASQRKHEFSREVETQLADVTREASLNEERLRAAEEDLKRTLVVAPEDGQVVGLFTQMPGAVITPGQRLLDIVPKDEALVLEVHIAPNLIDRVQVGLTADINLHGFVNLPQLVIDGVVTSVAGDLLTEPGPQGNVSYYLARVQVTLAGLKKLGSNRLQPGMPAEVVIKTGERTFLNYILRPLMRRMHSSLVES